MSSLNQLIFIVFGELPVCWNNNLGPEKMIESKNWRNPIIFEVSSVVRTFIKIIYYFENHVVLYASLESLEYW